MHVNTIMKLHDFGDFCAVCMDEYRPLGMSQSLCVTIAKTKHLDATYRFLHYYSTQEKCFFKGEVNFDLTSTTKTRKNLHRRERQTASPRLFASVSVKVVKRKFLDISRVPMSVCQRVHKLVIIKNKYILS